MSKESKFNISSDSRGVAMLGKCRKNKPELCCTLKIIKYSSISIDGIKLTSLHANIYARKKSKSFFKVPQDSNSNISNHFPLSFTLLIAIKWRLHLLDFPWPLRNTWWQSSSLSRFSFPWIPQKCFFELLFPHHYPCSYLTIWSEAEILAESSSKNVFELHLFQLWREGLGCWNGPSTPTTLFAHIKNITSGRGLN